MIFIFIAMMRCWCNVAFIFLMNLYWAFANAQVDTALKKVHTKIDEITTSKQIEDFLKSIDPEFSTFHVNDSLKFLDGECKHVSDSLQCTPWFKADFDNNGYSDLIVMGGWD